MNIFEKLHTEYGISYKKMAEELGLSASYISMIANGKREYPLKKDDEIRAYLKKLHIEE